MTDTPDWVLIEAAKRCEYADNLTIEYLRSLCSGTFSKSFRPLCDMILKHEQPPVDRKTICAQQAASEWDDSLLLPPIDVAVRAIELWEEGFGK